MIPLAAVLLLLLGIAHSVQGERYLLRRLFRLSLPPLYGSDVMTKRILRAAWHLTSIAWWGVAALLLSHFTSAETALRIVALTLGASALVSGVVTRGRHVSWVLLLAVAGLTWWSA